LATLHNTTGQNQIQIRFGNSGNGRTNVFCFYTFSQFEINLPPVVNTAATLRVLLPQIQPLLPLLAAHVEMLKCGNLFIRFMLFLACAAVSKLHAAKSVQRVHFPNINMFSIYEHTYIYIQIFVYMCIEEPMTMRIYVILCTHCSTTHFRNSKENGR